MKRFLPSGRGLAAAAALLVLAALALVPLRHRVRVEADAFNPVRRLQVESRSLLGLARPAWGLALEGVAASTDGHGSFYLMVDQPLAFTVRAWPGFRQSLSMTPAAVTAHHMLREEGDREAFRHWFVAILEQQLEGPSPAWEPAQRDCAGLLRFAFREALATHTTTWQQRVGFSSGPPGQDPSAAFSRTWRGGFPTPEGLQPFAKGAFLRRLACVSLGRDLQSAQPGDLLFFARGGSHSQPDHAMAFVRSDVDGMPMLLYHTGPEGSGATRQEGELRRVRLEDLLHHPEPDFRPLPENPAFLGLYRWRLLAGEPFEPLLPRS